MTSSVVGRIVGMSVCWHWWPIPLAHKYWKVHSHGFIRHRSTWSVTNKGPTKIKVPQIVTKCITGQFQTSNSISWKGLRQADSDQLHTTFHSTDLFCIVQKMKGNCYFDLGILGKPSIKKSAVFFNIVQKAFDPPPFIWTFVLFCRGCFFTAFLKYMKYM